MRSKILWFLGAALLVAALFLLDGGGSRSGALAQTFSPGPGPASIQMLPAVEQEVGRLTNAIRRQHGLPPLAADQVLVNISRQHSWDMLRRGFFSHINPEGRSLQERLPPAYASHLSGWGENIWTGSGYSPGNPLALARMMLDSWMSSPGHRRNILNPGYNRLGVGVAAWGRDVRATQVFGEWR